MKRTSQILVSWSLSGRGYCLALAGMLAGGGLSGCSFLDFLRENQYASHYYEVIQAPLDDSQSQTPPMQRTVLMKNHTVTVKDFEQKGYQVLGASEFQTASTPGRKHLTKQAQKVGANVVIWSRKFDRNEQRLVNSREYVSGERITVNGTTVETQGRWVNSIEVRDWDYFDYKATFLRKH